MNRENILAEMNKAAAKVAELRSTEAVDVDALSAAVVSLDAVRSELAAFDATAPATIAAAPTRTAAESIGRAAAAKLTGAPVGSEVTVDRTLIADPWGDVSGAQDATFSQNAGLSAGPIAPVRFIDILPTAPASSDSVTYIRETGFTNAAAARLAGSATAESEIALEKIVEPMANVAHKVRATEETLSDNGALATLIDRRGPSGVRAAVNAQALAATNTANGVKSVVAGGTAVTYTGDLADAILHEKLELIEAGFAPSHAVLSVGAYEALVTAKANGLYIANGPFGGSNASVWQLPVVIESAMPAGVDAVVCDSSGATLYVRDNASVKTSTDIDTGVVTVRVQTRCQLAVERPEAFRVLSAD